VGSRQEADCSDGSIAFSVPSNVGSRQEADCSDGGIVFGVPSNAGNLTDCQNVNFSRKTLIHCVCLFVCLSVCQSVTYLVSPSVS
jgi:hypothetical protein